MAGHSVTLEKMGIPTAPVVTLPFEDAVKIAVYAKGLPTTRFVFTPHPMSYITPEKGRANLAGNDPLTGKPILQEIVDSLTRPLTAEDVKVEIIERPRERVLQMDTEENLRCLFIESDWTAYLPVIMPTEERVAAMLKGTSRKPDEKVGEMQPSTPHEKWSYTVENVAVNAVMAGARPEYMPVILALAASGATSLFTSTNSFVAMACVNGPIRNQINMNMGIGAFGPFNLANATIGHAWTLISKNLGNGGAAGHKYMGSQGQGYNFTNLCFGEKEEALPQGWLPYHVQKGFKPEESVVSVFNGWSWSNIGGFEQNKSHTIKRFFTYQTQCCGQTMVLDPLVADLLYKEGFKSKEELNQWLKENVMFAQEEYWGRMPGVGGFLGERADDLEKAKQGTEPYASWLKLPEGAVIPVSRNINVNIMVTGGGTNPYWQGGTLRYIGSASVDRWR